MKKLAALALFAAAAALAEGPSSQPASQPAAKQPIQIVASAVPYKPAPPTMPPGTQIAVLEGDPKAPGAIFTIRLKVPAGTALPPHWHPSDERVTVMEGTWSVGFGDVVDKAKGTTFLAGSFYVTPTPMHHFAWTDTGAVLQITGVGPWETRPVDARR